MNCSTRDYQHPKQTEARLFHRFPPLPDLAHGHRRPRHRFGLRRSRGLRLWFSLLRHGRCSGLRQRGSCCGLRGRKWRHRLARRAAADHSGGADILGRPAEDQVAVLEFRAQAAELREATQELLLVEEAIRRRLLEQTHDRSQTERVGCVDLATQIKILRSFFVCSQKVMMSIRRWR